MHSISAAHQTVSPFHGHVANQLRQPHDNLGLLFRDARRIAVTPRRFYQHASCFAVAGRGDSTATGPFTAGLFRRHETQIRMNWRGASNRRRSPIAATKITAEMKSRPRKLRSASTSGPIDQAADMVRYAKASPANSGGTGCDELSHSRIGASRYHSSGVKAAWDLWGLAIAAASHGGRMNPEAVNSRLIKTSYCSRHAS
jgi:hypothetical protein